MSWNDADKNGIQLRRILDENNLTEMEYQEIIKILKKAQ